MLVVEILLMLLTIKESIHKVLLSIDFIHLFSLQWLISKKLSVITTMFWPVYYLSEKITYEQDEQVEDLLDPYFDFLYLYLKRIFWTRVRF